MTELKAYTHVAEELDAETGKYALYAYDVDGNRTPVDDTELVYLKSEADEAISELKVIISQKEDAIIKAVDLGYKIKKEREATNRALWLARAERAHVTTLLWNVYCYQNNCLYFRDFMNEKCNPFRDLPKKTAMEWSDLWESIETKCRVKAEEYK